jgi:hypothetical protein
MKLRREIVEPKEAKSRTAKDDPKRTLPTKENELPNLAKFRREKVEPMLMKSKTDKEDPKRDIPNTDNALPRRM